MKTYIGIDPGSKGFITVMEVNENVISTDFLSMADNSPAEISDYLCSKMAQCNGNCFCIMEEIHAIYGASAKSTFSFGEIFGILKGIIYAYKIPFDLVPPKTWQSEIWNNSDKVKVNGKVDTKKTSINAARRLFPSVDLRRTPACKNVDDNKCDSLLICEYARRKNL